MTKKKEQKTLNIDNILLNCRNYLRAARNSGSFLDKRDMMLTLVFLRFIGEKYEDGIEVLRQTLIEQGLDIDDENIRAAFFDDATFADGTYNLPAEARWSTIINTPAPKLNVALDTALSRLEEDPQLKGCFIKGTFTTCNLAANDIKKIVDEINKISHKAFGEEKDLIGYVYEYFLKEFAVNATKEEGEFYTPHDVVQLIAAMIEPFEGTLYDPACGSGGMFIQSAELVKSKQGDLNSINIYGQEKEKRNPVKKLLLFMFVPFYSIYWIYKSAERIDILANKKGVESNIATACLLLALLFPIIALIVMQSKINKICNLGTENNEGAANNSSTNVSETLKMYKDLLDQGAITQEDYDIIKKKTLGL